ncbi:hypothetical protein Rhopal_001289-T1 [Rhodotorula paludigena]|uniref:Uncharacterized protein n=1 Tax=Rhodotorula paludigena TaxID=86838 RepID=A0AAV5GGD3_9BASI|nr:hypothetical protein Rhopal_001289-T1 [Rhodotorula paludigena]
MDRQLALLQRHYAALSPSSPALLPSPPFPAPSTLSLPATQQFLADRLLGHEQALGDERGAHDWKRLFWRRVTKGIELGFSERRAQGDAEVDDEEVHPDILEAMVDLLSSGSSAGAPGTSTRVYYWGDLAAEPDQWQSIRTREEGRLISGARLMQACIALSNHLIASPAPVVRARRILELGAGVGLLTLVAARLAQQGEKGDEARRRFVATDVDEKVLETLQQNIRSNDLDDLAECVKLDWELASDLTANVKELQRWRNEAFEGGGEPDLILGADIAPSTLAWLLQPRQGRETAPEALIAGTIRNESTWELFLHECRVRQLQVNAVDLQVPPDQSGIVGAQGWEAEGEVRLVRIVAQ